MQVSIPEQVFVNGSSLPDTPPPPLPNASNKVKILALALFIGLGLATLTAGLFLSIKVIVFIGSFCTIASVATTIIGIQYLSTSEVHPKRNNQKELDDIELIKSGDIELARKKIESADFWKGVTQEEKKKALLKTWLERTPDIAAVPFNELDSSYLVLAYETVREIDPNSPILRRLYIKFRCPELIKKMSLHEIYSQNGDRIMDLFAGHEDLPEVKAVLNNMGYLPFDWGLWKKFESYHGKFILSILIDLHANPDEKKRVRVTDFISDLFDKIDRVNFLGDKEQKKANLIRLLYAAAFKYAAEDCRNPKDEWKQTYNEFLKERSRANS